MTGVDMTGWKSFKIEDLFDVEKGTRLTKRDMTPGDMNFIGASAVNNGVTAHIGNAGHVFPGGLITVCYNGSIGESFYQPEPFWASDDVNILIPRTPLDETTALFLLPILRETGRRYKYLDKWRQEVMKEDTIMLPATSDGQPDWEYMRDHMRHVLDEAKQSINSLTVAGLRNHPLDSSRWREYPIKDLFVVQKGTRLTRANMTPGTIPFIGATLENNGITAHVGNREHLHPGGTITVAYNGQKATGKAFYQPKTFWASDDVNVLYPKFELNETIALYLQPIFWEASHAFSYDNKWNKAAMEQTTLTLPVKEDGSPDWEYMQCFMQQAIDDADKAISQLEEL